MIYSTVWNSVIQQNDSYDSCFTNSQSAFYKFESSPRFTSPVQSAFYNMLKFWCWSRVIWLSDRKTYKFRQTLLIVNRTEKRTLEQLLLRLKREFKVNCSKVRWLLWHFRDCGTSLSEGGGSYSYIRLLHQGH